MDFASGTHLQQSFIRQFMVVLYQPVGLDVKYITYVFRSAWIDTKQCPALGPVVIKRIATNIHAVHRWIVWYDYGNSRLLSIAPHHGVAN